MMDGLPLALLFGAAIVNSAVPGPCILVTVGRAAHGGLGAGLRVGTGIVAGTGLLVAIAWTVMLGVVALSPEAFVAMKLCGILALVLIALAMARAQPSAERASFPWRPAGDLGAGIAVGLASPVNLVFMLAILPQFVAVERATAASFAVTLGVVLAATAPPLVVASALGAGFGGIAPRGAPWIGRASAVALLAFAGAATLTFP